MAFEPQNKLERSLMRAAVDPASRPQFYRDFIESDIFIIEYGPPPARPGRKVLEKGYQLRIQPIEINGKPYLPIFSSLPRLQAFLRHEAGYIALNALEFLKITQGADLILNPGAEYGKEFLASEIAAILDGSIWQPQDRYIVQKETNVMIGQPVNYPRELVEALVRLYKKRREVKRAWLAHFYNPERDEKPHTLIALEVSGNWDQISAETGIVIQGVPVPDPPVDVLQITGRGGIEEYFIKTKPFYEKKTLGLF